MKNRSNGMDPELEKQIEGMTTSQKKLLASIYAGIADRLKKKHAAESLAKWKDRKQFRWN